MLLSEDTMDFDDPDDTWSCWKDIFLTVAEKHAPPKRKRIKNKKSPWINGNIRKRIIERDRLKKAAIKTNDPEDWANYKHAKNTTNNEIKKTKALYYHSHIDKKLWQLKGNLENY